MIEEHPSGESFVERPTKEDLHQKKGVIFCKADRRLRKTPCLEEQTNSLRRWSCKRLSTKQTVEKSKTLTTGLSSIDDIVSHKEGVVKKLQELVDKESKALEEALDYVRIVQYVQIGYSANEAGR